MTKLEQFFDRILVINLARRRDRWDKIQSELAANGVDLKRVERFDAFDNREHAMVGCTKSHRAAIRELGRARVKRGLILEDDAEVITRQKLVKAGFFPNSLVLKTFDSALAGQGNLQLRFSYLSHFLPQQWDMLYLGGGYGGPPISRFNRHVVRHRHMKCCSSYAMTGAFAKEWSRRMDETVGENNPGAPDDLFASFADEFAFCTFQPRLMFQGDGKSDITGQSISYLYSMTDPVHENMV